MNRLAAGVVLVLAQQACMPPQGPSAESLPGTPIQGGETPSPAARADAQQSIREAYLRGDLQAARAQLEAAAKAAPNDCQAHYALGSVRQRMGALTLAEASYRAALAQLPSCEQAVLAQTQLLLSIGRASEAERWLTGLQARFPDSAGVLTARAEVHSVGGRSSEAQQLARQALKRNPDHRPAMLLIARDHFRTRRYDLALYALTAILDGYGAENPARDPNNGEAMLVRALIFKEQGRRRAAMAEFERALAQRPDLLEARLNLSAFMLEAGNAAQAAPLLEVGLAFDNANVLLHQNLGDAYRLLGRVDEAIKQLEWVVQAAPTQAAAYYNLGLIYLFSPSVPGVEGGRALSKAIQYFERYKALRPRGKASAGDDVDELIARARNKKAVLEAMGAPRAGAAPANSPPADQKALQ